MSSADCHLQEITKVEWLCGEKGHPVPAVKNFSRPTKFAHGGGQRHKNVLTGHIKCLRIAFYPCSRLVFGLFSSDSMKRSGSQSAPQGGIIRADRYRILLWC